MWRIWQWLCKTPRTDMRVQAVSEHVHAAQARRKEAAHTRENIQRLVADVQKDVLR